MTPDQLKELLQRPLREIAAALGVSHETARRMRNRHNGKCLMCGAREPHPGSLSCLACLKKQRVGKWQPGRRGRPPVEAIRG